MPFFRSIETKELLFFLNDLTHDVQEEKRESRVYKYSKGDKQVNIHFDSIHGVKGETHTATLYLESFLRIYDIGGKILNFIISDEKAQTKLRRDGACKKQLPLAYVALTRATHFVAIAVNQNRFLPAHQAYFELNKDKWDVIYV